MGVAGIESGTVLQDTYRIVRPIGQGGMGAVFEAVHTRLAGRYAVKVLHQDVAAHQEAFSRFRREANVTSALRHPNIVYVMDFNQTPDGHPYLVMEFLEGTDLAARLQRTGPMSLADTVALVNQVASALAAAHGRDIVHRDLKPQNIFLVAIPGQERMVAKIVDFGISKVKTATQNLTRESTVLGTPQYMSPEQALGRSAEVDARTDQLALAAIVYEMISGRAAFTGETLDEVLHKVVHDDPPAMEGVAPAVERVIRRGLSKRREARFGSVLEFAGTLAAAASGPHGAGERARFDATRTEVIDRASGRRQRWRILALAGVVVTGIASVAAIRSLVARPAPSRSPPTAPVVVPTTPSIPRSRVAAPVPPTDPPPQAATPVNRASGTRPLRPGGGRRHTRPQGHPSETRGRILDDF